MGKATATFSTATFPYVDPLCVENIVSRGGTMLSGSGVVIRGTLLEFAAGKWKPAAATAMGILADDVDATSADASCVVYVGGIFMASGITWGALAHDVATEQLRDVGIQLESVMSGVGTMVKGVPLDSERIRVDDTAITKDLHPKEILTDSGPVPLPGEGGVFDSDEHGFEPHPAPLRVQPGHTEPPVEKPAHGEHPEKHKPVAPPRSTEPGNKK